MRKEEITANENQDINIQLIQSVRELKYTKNKCKQIHKKKLWRIKFEYILSLQKI